MADRAIQFSAQIFKIQTLIDGGMRLTLDLEPSSKVISQLFKAKQPGVTLEVAAVPVLESFINGKKNTDSRPALDPLDVVSC